MFTLVVGDFGVKYTDPADLDHLIACLHELYEIKVHRTGGLYSYLGYTVHHDKPQRIITLSMPDYIPNMLKRLRPHGLTGKSYAPSPGVYISSAYGQKKQLTALDTSGPASAAQKNDIQ